jgi:2-keto-4-pentenoate hydratase/2-oxohepta-3-ene-1,7-dioic acid hydratase in catechol pathway
MKLVSYYLKKDTSRQFQRGVLVDGGVIPIPGEFNALRPHDLETVQNYLKRVGGEGQIALDEVRLGPPLLNPPKIICVGLNYLDHAKEAGMPVPERPILFSKWNNSLAGPEDEIPLDGTSQEVDYEAELCFVVGQRAYRVSEANALDYVAGYMCSNDVSARDLQLRLGGGQWVRGKSLDGFCPIGPYLATKDEIPDSANLRIACRVNGQTLQDSNTAQLIFKVPALLSFISQGITLEPGDIVLTGTPSGVGYSRKEPIFLHPGDICEIEIEGLGILRNRFVER